jgi:hypothetical protein
MKLIQTAIAAGALLLAASDSFADDAHHPDESAPAAPAVTAPQQDLPNGMTSGGMMQGMMSADMMRMMMGMMASGNGPAMEQSGSMGPMMSPEHIEGRIAFLETELVVTDAQQPLWATLAEVLRKTAASAGDTMPGMQGGMMADNGATAATPIERFVLQENVLATRLEALRQVRVALEPFYAALDETQKLKANRLLSPAPMGMM